MSDEAILKRFEEEFKYKVRRATKLPARLSSKQELKERFLIFLCEVLGGRRGEIMQLAHKQSEDEKEKLRDALLYMVMQYCRRETHEHYIEFDTEGEDSNNHAAELLLRLGVFYEGDGRLYKMRRSVKF